MSRKISITVTDEQADVLDAIAHIDQLRPSLGGTTTVKHLVAYACATALRERPEVARAVEARQRWRERDKWPRREHLRVVS